jgi:hypothetical protein
MRWVAPLAALFALAASSANAEQVTFEVEVPYCTPVGAAIMLRSNRLDAGVFRHDPLTRVDRTHYRGMFDVAIDRSLFRYRYSHGTCDDTRCEGIEKDVAYTGVGADVPDRTVPSGSTSVSDLVFIWRDAVRKFDQNGAPAGLRATSEKVAFCGPYVSVSDENGEVTISYDAFDAREVVLEYGPTSAYGNRLASNGQHRNRFRLPGLTPGQVVHYRIIEAGESGPDFSFTAPPAPGDPFRFAFLGDAQYYEEADRVRHRDVVRQIEAFDPHLVLSPGDMVASLRDANGFMPPEMGRFNVFFGQMARLMARSPFMVAMGNHEEDVDYYWDVFEFPKNDFPRIDHYWFRYGNVHFTILYTGVTEGYDVEGMLSVQTPWLEGVLAQATRDPNVRWKVIVLHRGPYSQGSVHPTDGQEIYSNSSATRRSWAQVWADHGVDLVLAGHNHNFTLASNDGTRFVTSCGGAPTHDLRMPNLATTLYAEETCSADLFEVGAKTLSLRVLRPDGSEISAGGFSLCRVPSDCDELANPCSPSERVAWSCVIGACTSACMVPPPAIELDPDRLAFRGQIGALDPDPQIVRVEAAGGANVAWTIAECGTFLSCDPSSGTTPSDLTVRAAIAGLAEGTHEGRVIVAAHDGTSSGTVAVSLELRSMATTDAGMIADSGFDDAAEEKEDASLVPDAGKRDLGLDVEHGGGGSGCACSASSSNDSSVFVWIALAASIRRRRAARPSSAG